MHYTIITGAHQYTLSGGTLTVLALIVVWEIIWKGLALWHAAHSGQKAWFIVLLLINSIGLLEIAYLFFLSKPRSQAVRS